MGSDGKRGKDLHVGMGSSSRGAAAVPEHVVYEVMSNQDTIPSPECIAVRRAFSATVPGAI